MSIRLHPKYGVNPTVCVCFFCGKEKNELALLGSAYHGEAPHKMVLDKRPCDECKKMMAQGVMLISVRDGSDHENPYRTGGMVVIKVEAANRIFSTIGDKRVAFLEDSVWKRIGLPLDYLND